MGNTTTPQEPSKPPLPKWIGTATAGTAALLISALLQKFGDSVFDTLQASLGKKLVVQAIGLLLVLLGYFAWLHFRKPRTKKLTRRRAVYWAHGDSTPFCAFCYETASKHHHLVGPIEMHDPSVERWECRVCHHDYAATKTGADFLMKNMRGVGAWVA